MKSTAIPAVRVTPELRRAAEEVLEEGETLSGFIAESVRRNVEFRREQRAFVARGLASAAAARESGRYVSSEVVLGKLARRLARAQKGSSPSS